MLVYNMASRYVVFMASHPHVLSGVTGQDQSSAFYYNLPVVTPMFKRSVVNKMYNINAMH